MHVIGIIKATGQGGGVQIMRESRVISLHKDCMEHCVPMNSKASVRSQCDHIMSISMRVHQCAKMKGFDLSFTSNMKSLRDKGEAVVACE